MRGKHQRGMPTFTPLSFRRGVLEGGMGVRFPAGLKTLGAVGLRKGACFGMPLSGAVVGGGAISGRGHDRRRPVSATCASCALWAAAMPERTLTREALVLGACWCRAA